MLRCLAGCKTPAGAQGCPSGFSARPSLPAWYEVTMQEACVTPHRRWDLGPDVELGWTLPAGTLTTLHCWLFRFHVMQMAMVNPE